MTTSTKEQYKVMVLGDAHGEFDSVKHCLELESPDMAIICGDYGIWNDFPDKISEKYNTDYPCDVYFIDGNHDNHDALDKYERGKIHKLTDRLYYCAYGSSFTINSKTFLFCGGAESIDKQFRTPGVSWWATECISESDQQYLPDMPIDIVISHTAPDFILNKLFKKYGVPSTLVKHSDPSVHYLTEVYKKYKPEQWFFGHMHVRYHTCFKRTKFDGLNMVPFNEAVTRKNISECSFCLFI